jgi:hypothetical protein
MSEKEKYLRWHLADLSSNLGYLVGVNAMTQRRYDRAMESICKISELLGLSEEDE